MDDHILILNRLNEIEEIMSNVYYKGEPLNYSNGYVDGKSINYSPKFNKDDALRLAKEASVKKRDEAWGIFQKEWKRSG